MKVSDVMTRDVACCALHDTLDVAAGLMWERDCGCVPVVDEQRRVVGIITDRDIAMAAMTQGKPLAQIPVASAAHGAPHCVQPGDPVDMAESLMAHHQIRRLPVTTSEGRVTGILSMNDLARRTETSTAQRSALSGDSIAQTLSAICKPRPETHA